MVAMPTARTGRPSKSVGAKIGARGSSPLALQEPPDSLEPLTLVTACLATRLLFAALTAVGALLKQGRSLFLPTTNSPSPVCEALRCGENLVCSR